MIPSRRGLGPGVCAAASLAEPVGRIEPPERLLEAAIVAVFKSVPAAAVGVVANLMLRSGVLTRLGMTSAVFSIALMTASFDLTVRGEPASQSWPRPHPVPAPAEVARGPSAPIDRYADPLPKHARVRLGGDRFNHGQSINHVLYTPDGKSLVAIDSRGGVRVWDAATGRLVRIIGSPSTRFRQIAISPDGQTLATIEDPGRLCVWELPSGLERRRWHAIPGFYQCLTFSPDGQTIAAGISTFDDATKREERAINMWDVTAATEHRRRLAGDWSALWGLAFTPDGKTLVSGSDDTESRVMGEKPEKGSTRLWDVATGRERCRFSVTGFHVRSIAVSPAGRLVAAGVTDLTIRVYDLAAGREHALQLGQDDTLRPKAQGDLVIAPAGHNPNMVMTCLAFTPDGSILASGSSGTGNTGSSLLAEVYLWDVAHGKLLRHFQAHQGWVQSLTFSPDGRTVASAGSESMIRLTDSATGREVLPQSGHRSWIRTLVVSPADGTIFTGGQDGTVRHWDPASGRELGVIARFDAPPYTMAITPDGKALLIGGAFGAPVLYSASGRGEIRRFSGVPQPGFDFSITLAPDGRTFACQGSIWETATGKVVARFRDRNGQPPGPRTRMFYSPTREEILTIRREGVTIWDIAAGKEVRQAVRSRVQDYHPALSPDGRLLATGGRDESVRGGELDPAIHLWELASGQEVEKLEGHKGATRELAFSPDGRFLASGGTRSANSMDETVRVWDVATGLELRRFEGHLGSVNAVAFTSDGRSVVSGSEDATAFVWDVSDLADRPKTAKPIAAEALKAGWDGLAATDARTAFRATWALSLPSAVAFLRERLCPATSPDPEGFPRASGPIAPPEVLRTMRAIAALERVGTPEARSILERMARGYPGAIETREAKSALDRLSR